ncbi:Translational repressor [Recurvomyces mirabilis]|uniref:Translational repressor n=1 Tax=Recurvomyces mirabilis TaxID=574656 RepID=A0AAE0TTT6_9PEZI|nr:Translational repressor [Recurvomyces mirabilis]KAK5160173.1 Translational repressor [Recurvomyces mirabilis]
MQHNQQNFDPNQGQGQNGQGGQGAAGRRLHIAHRRSPSEMTPLMMEQLALAQQIEMLQQQQQQIAATHQQYVNMGMIQPQQQLPNQFQQMQGQMQGLNIASNPNAFQFQQQPMGSMGGGQHLGIPGMSGGMGGASAHRRNQSAMPNMGMGSMGPPPAPSSGASGSAFGDFSFPQAQQQTRAENSAPRGGGRGGGAAGGGHARRHSLALPEAKKAAELAEAKRKTSGFQFPVPNAGGESPSTSHRSVSPGQAPPSDTLQTPQSTTTPRGGFGGRGHGRSQSMAVGGRGMAASSRGGPTGFSFPAAQATNDGGANTSDLGRRGSQGHGRTQSRNFEGNWRAQSNNPQQAPIINEPNDQNFGNFQMNQATTAQPFQPGHRQRGSMAAASMSSLGGFQYQPQPQLVQLPQGQVLVQQPAMFNGQQLSALQLAQLQAYQQAGIQPPSIAQLTGQHNGPNFPNQQQQQRKTLFTPYLPQATLPALLGDGQLVAGILRVNKKNRSDAYVTTTDLDADIFICGSKDRNRALEGDLVAVELLDVDEVWTQKREKEEKKKRKDATDQRSGSVTAVNDATTAPESSGETGLRRRGSLKQRPTQKKNDDVEVEGQSLLLMEEDEINDEQKPLYAGHVVAVIERIPGQMFSGSLGLLRPSSQATKEKQEAERQQREGGNHRPERPQERPKIVWFKPTDKRVPLIAIPTEQAPRDFVERHQSYANKIFVACIKRWPITSLHPFGTLVEELGEAGNLKVETDALLRDNNFGPDDFSDAVVKNIGFEDWSVANDGETALEGRRDFREDKTFTIDPNGSKELDDALHFKDLGDGLVEIGMHVADVAHFVKANSLVDREAKKRGTGVYLMNRTVNMLPARLSQEVCCLSPGEDRYTLSVVFKINSATGRVIDDETWVGKGVIRSDGKLAYEEVDAVINGGNSSLPEDRQKQILMLHNITQKFRQVRFGGDEVVSPPLRLVYQLDDENVPVEQNIFDSSPSHEMIEELSHKTNALVAEKIFQAMPERALLRRQASPNPRRLQTFAERMSNIGIEIDISSSAALQNSLFRIEDDDVRKGMETLVIKAMTRARYFVPGKIPDDSLSHYALNLPLYTHFTNPSRRYADIVVQRQLEAALSDGTAEFNEDLDSLAKTAETCNTKKDSARAAQEQSVHIESCRAMNCKSEEQGGDLISVGIVVCVYESAFDVLIPEYGFEKRVHCDQLPLKKAEFDKNSRLLELYWEKGVPSSAFVPEDERPQAKSHASSHQQRGMGSISGPTRHQPEAQKQNMQTGTIDTNDVDALFDDDEDNASEVTDHHNAGVALNGDRATQSGPPSPSRNGMAPQRSKSDSRILNSVPEGRLTNKEKYLGYFDLREEGGNYIQDVREMMRVPVLLKTDLGKSPP